MKSSELAGIATLKRKQLAGLLAVAEAMTVEAKAAAGRYSDTGRLSAGFKEKVDGKRVLWGNTVSHAEVLEFGFSPRWVRAPAVLSWAQRVGYLARNPRARGVFVGGPNSRLEYGGAGARATVRRGKQAMTKTYATRGGRSPYLAPGEVGRPIMQPVASKMKTAGLKAFIKGHRDG